MSLRYLERVFEHAGSSPATYIRDQRLERSLRLLSGRRHGRFAISAVGARVGYRAANFFVRALRQKCGFTPAVWRARHDNPEDSKLPPGLSRIADGWARLGVRSSGCAPAAELLAGGNEGELTFDCPRGAARHAEDAPSPQVLAAERSPHVHSWLHALSSHDHVVDKLLQSP